ncbi:MAG: DUF4178 domain-containing protein [Aggregatilineales bacterium]
MVMSTPLPVLKKMECPNCGSPLEQRATNAQTIVCSTCGSFIAVGAEQPEVTSKSPQKPPPPPKPITLGAKGLLDGTEFFVMGRVVYTGWDARDTSDRWTWHEWLLGGADGRLLWLSFDEKGFTLYKKMRFREQFDPATARALPLGNGAQAMIRERYPARIVGAEGELTWKATAGEQLFVAEGAGQGKRYSIQKTAEEMEIHEGVPISEAMIAAAFGDENWQKRAVSSGGRTGGIPTRLMIGILCVLFAMIAFVVGSFAGNSQGNIIGEQRQVNLTQSANSVDVPVNISSTRRPHSVTLTVQTSASGSFPITVNIVDPTAQQRLVFSQTMSVAGGTASGEFVPFRSGEHLLRISTTSTSFDSATVTVAVRRGLWTTSWFTTYAVIIGLIGGFLVISGLGRMSGTTKG